MCKLQHSKPRMRSKNPGVRDVVESIVQLSTMTEIKKVAVIGSGSIGASFAALFAAHGLQTAVYDINPAAEAFLAAMTKEAAVTLAKLRGNETSAAELAQQMRSKLSFSCDLETTLHDVDFVQENGPERLEQKLDLLSRIDKLVKPSTIIASSTSGFMCSSMQGALARHPERFVVGHPFNPPHLYGSSLFSYRRRTDG